MIRTLFPSLGILEHYAKFDTRTIITLEKLLGARSFGGSTKHLTHHRYILHVSPGEFNLPSIIRTTPSTFLGCWALVALALITCFQQDDHPIF